MLRDMRTRFSDQSLGFLWAVMEPVGMIAALALLFSTGLKGREPALGESYILFFASGMLPYSAYKSVTGAINRSAKGNRNLLFFPIVKPIDSYVASAVLETTTMVVVMSVIFVSYHVAFGGGLPDSFIMTIVPFIYAALIGFSIGVFNVCIGSVFKSWVKIFKMTSRPMFFISGIFFIAESLPRSIQNILYYNPILHITEWTRQGYFAEFNSDFLDLYYLNGFTISALFIALALERTMRPQVLTRM
ncbi:capsular polysaccharide transport system permease protein [Rhodobium orientis]|nr:capsular polysaccharide transport system permease protein [Rhodobium orientis]